MLSLGTEGFDLSKVDKSYEYFDVGIGFMQEAFAFTENS